MTDEKFSELADGGAKGGPGHAQRQTGPDPRAPRGHAAEEACRLLVRLRGIMLAYENLACTLEGDAAIDTALEHTLQRWSEGVMAYLEHAYSAGMALLGLSVDRERCRHAARSRLVGSVTEHHTIAGLADAIEEAAHILGAYAERPDCEVAETLAPLTHDASCGLLRREGDGTWWYNELYLGRDDQPNTTCFDLASNVALVTLRLYHALIGCSSRLCDQGLPDASDVLARFEAWRSTGRWPQLVEELRSAGFPRQDEV